MILDDILERKRAEIADLHRRYDQWEPPQAPPARRGFADALRREGISLIAEFKRRSPSRGDIRPGAEPDAVARTYERHGAAAMSVLTDAPFFGGSLADLASVHNAAELPLLRKDFIIDPVQIAESAVPEGPDCLLLIVAVLGADQLRSLRELAGRCGQASLIEVHNEEEVEAALESGADVIGINNRDLRTFQVSLDTTLRLRSRIPDGRVVVSESGIHTADDVRRLADIDVHAILVGEALMAAGDPGAKIKELLGRP